MAGRGITCLLYQAPWRKRDGNPSSKFVCIWRPESLLQSEAYGQKQKLTLGVTKIWTATLFPSKCRSWNDIGNSSFFSWSTTKTSGTLLNLKSRSGPIARTRLNGSGYSLARPSCEKVNVKEQWTTSEEHKHPGALCFQLLQSGEQEQTFGQPGHFCYSWKKCSSPSRLHPICSKACKWIHFNIWSERGHTASFNSIALKTVLTHSRLFSEAGGPETVHSQERSLFFSKLFSQLRVDWIRWNLIREIVYVHKAIPFFAIPLCLFHKLTTFEPFNGNARWTLQRVTIER